MPFFQDAVSSWNDLQVEFVRYCHFYYSYRNDPEGPDEDILDDDFLLQQWINKRKIEDRIASIKEKTSLNKTRNKTEVFK